MVNFTQKNLTFRKNTFRSFVTTLGMLLTLLLSNAAFAQPSTLGTQTVNGGYSTYDLVTRGGGVRFVRMQATSSGTTGTRNWEFAMGTSGSMDYSTNWRPYGSGLTLSGYNAVIAPVGGTASALYNTSSGGSSGLMPAVTSGNYYTFIVGGLNANNTMSVLETTYSPKNITACTQSPVAASVYAGQAVTVTLTTSAPLSTGEKAYIRYSTDGFATSTIAAVSMASTTGTATIPGTSNLPGATVSYYVFTSTSATAPSTAQADYFTLNLYNASGQNASGGGTNFSYTVASTGPTYTWTGATSTAFGTTTNWTPTRSSAGVYDNLVFNNGLTNSVTAVPTQTIGAILVSSNTIVNLNATAGVTLTINNGASGADLSVAAGSQLNESITVGAFPITIALATGATGSISGSMTFSSASASTASTLTAVDASGITFNNGSSFTQGTNITGSVFGSGTANSVVFASGATFNHNAGANPFQKTQPASVVVFNSGSNFISNQANGVGLGFSGRTFGNLTIAGGGTGSGSGSAATYIENLYITNNSTFSFGMTGTGAAISSIVGNITVDSGSSLNFNGTGASIQFNGTSQTISGAGSYAIATGQVINIPSGKTTSFQSNMSVTGTGVLDVFGTLDMGTAAITGTGTVTIESAATLRSGNSVGIMATGSNTGSIQTSTRNYNTGANYVYNGTINQNTGTGLPATVNSLVINNTGSTSNKTVTLNNAAGTSTGTVTLQAGLLDLNNKQLNISTGGTITATSGDFTATAGPVNFAGTGTVSGTVNFPTVQVSGGVNFGSASNIVTSLQINTGGYVNTNAPTYGASSTLIYNTTGTYNRGTEWSATSGKGYPNHVSIKNSTTLDVVNGSNAYKKMAGSMNIAALSTLSVSGLTNGDGSGVGLDILGDIINDGTITLSSGTSQRIRGANFVNGSTNTTATTTLSGTVGGDLEVTGNFTDNAAFTSNNRAVFFSGSAAQTIGGTATAPFNVDYIVSSKTGGSVKLLVDCLTGGPNGGNAITLTGSNDIFDLNGKTFTIGTSGVTSAVSGTGVFRGSSASNLIFNGTGSGGSIRFDQTTPDTTNVLNNLTINRTTSGAMSLGNELNVNGTLTLTAGTLSLGTNNLIIGASGAISVSSPDNTKMIIANGAGQLRKVFTANGSFTYPVGDSSSNYTPATLNFTAGSYSSAYAGINLTKTKHSSNTSATDYISRFWTVTSSGITSPTYTGSFTYVASDVAGTEANLYGGRYASSAWTCMDAVNTTTHTISKSISAFGDITAGDIAAMGCCVNPTDGGTIATDEAICSAGDPAAFTSSTLPTGNNGTLEYKWQASTTSASAGFSDISGATGTTYDAPSGLTVDTWYKRLSKVTCSGTWASSGESNVVHVSIKTAVAITSVTATDASVCSGATTTVTANGVAGTNATVTWYSGTGATGSTLGTGTSLSDVGAGTYYAYVTGDCGTPAETSVTVGSKTNIAITSVTALSTTLCAGETTTVSANGVAGTNALVTWYTETNGGGDVLGTGTSLTDVGAGTYYAYVTGDCGTPAEASVSVGSFPNLPASVSVASDATDDTLCEGTNVTFTATPTNGGTTPSYQWKKNGTNVGTDSATYSSSALVDGDVIKVVMTSNASPCLTGSPATSNEVTMTVNAYVTASVSIASNATDDTFCDGTNVTFTATPTNGGTTPSYQWKKNGSNVGTDSATYSSTTLADADVISVVMTSNATPCLTGSPATSNDITVTVNSNITASVSIASDATDDTICSGTNVTFTATPTNGGSAPAYQWKKNGTNVGTDSATYSTTTLADADVITVVMTSNETACVSGSPATSNEVIMAVNGELPASVSIASNATDDTICQGTNVTFTATPTNGGSAPTYQWKKNGSNVGTNSATYSSTTIADADVITVVMTSNASPCLTGSPATSNEVTITVFGNNAASVSVTSDASGDTICEGTNVTFTAHPVNGGTAPSYEWFLNGENVGTDSATFATSTLTVGDVVSVTMTSNLTPCLTGSPASSGDFEITVIPNVTASVSVASDAASNTSCVGSTVTFTATPTNGGSTPVYQWKLNGTNVGDDSAEYFNSTLITGDVVSVVMTSNAGACTLGSPATSNSVTMTVLSYTSTSVSMASDATDDTICTGGMVTFTATPTNGGSAPQYQWVLNESNVGENSPTFSSNLLEDGDVLYVVMISNASVCLTGSPSFSNDVTMTVNDYFAPSVSIASNATDDTLCSGTSVTFTATPTNGGATPSYQWTVNDSNVGDNSSTFETTELVDGDVVSLVMTSNATGCLSTSQGVSNNLTMTVNTTTYAAVSVSSDAVDNAICPDANLTFTANPSNGGSTPSYQWKLNGTNVGTDSTTYANDTLSNGDIVTVTMTSNAICVVGSPVTSDDAVVTVNVPTTYTSLTAAADTICATDTTLLTVNGLAGTNAVVSWFAGTDANGTYLQDGPTYDAAPGTYFASVYGTCGTPTGESITINAYGDAVGGTVSSDQTICPGRTPASISVADNTGAVQKWQMDTDSAFTSPIDIAETSTTLAGSTIGALSTTTYLRAVIDNGGCSTAYSSYATISMGGTSTWSGTAWDETPVGTSSLVFEGNFTSTGDVTACSCTVNSGAVVMSSSDDMFLSGPLTVNGGSMTFNNNAYLLQTDASATNSGNIIMKRDTNALKRLDYVMWSSPVANQILLNFSPMTQLVRFYNYDTLTSLYTIEPTPASTNFGLGNGYLIRMPNNHPSSPTVWHGQFTGTPHNGTVSVDVSTAGQGYNLIGNPYPSTLDLGQFAADNASNISGTLYFWRKTNQAVENAYSTWTDHTFVSNSEGVNPNDVLQMGQGFIVQATGSSVEFNNGQRIANHGNQMFKGMNNLVAPTVNRNRFWLNMTSPNNEYTQMAVGYNSNASQDVDATDGKQLNDGSITLSSYLNNTPYIIQGRALPFDVNDVVPLVYSVSNAGTYTISLDHVDGFFSGNGQEIMIKDNLYGTYNSLNAGSFTFTSEAGTYNDRFQVVYQNPLSVGAHTLNTNNVIIYKQNTDVVINTGNVIMDNVKIYDIRGRLLLEKSHINQSETRMNVGDVNQVLIVKVTSVDNEVVNKKVIN
ncbi:T9SS sorting signal type C domain-containing protein [Flavobacterium sp. SUN046]|uniref:T9SS sorting signal type C domain-containing protein n=1 Tax=Flavobacterium sp. SUN046 TaxID=3002440 RepID=UPI002DBE6758|nr:T9SS sorting signal type C domain-containing protein [Flavobacterium sp. SUN046]MEC4049480.1 T9SS sorting signal type C domain-containing protein [Flavobacterium sp. SUN046]